MTLTDSTLLYSKICMQYAQLFELPEARLRFFNNTLARQAACTERLNNSLRRFEFIKETKLYKQFLDILLHKLIIQELSSALRSASKSQRRLLMPTNAPFAAHLFFRCYQLRHLLSCIGIALVIAALFGTYSLVVHSAHRINDYFVKRYQTNGKYSLVISNQNNADSLSKATYLPDYRPEKVWLVEHKDNYERYSNGVRILTDYETDNHSRKYFIYQSGNGVAGETVHTEPTGIVYHTSENHMMPFTSDNSDSIETHTRGLLEYVRKNKSYNYVIDRFGQVYRIVRDSNAANHAGNSIWANEQEVYVGLNESFLGVCFETKSDTAVLDEQLTEAQLVAGRLLSQVLRSRYDISDANCVTHGLVSINPDKMLICYHHDWARNFPFEAFGFSDKYKIPPASMTELGFTYDDETINKNGGSLWAGVAKAEEEFAHRAEAEGKKPEELRRLMRDRYRKQMQQQRALLSLSSTETNIIASQ